MTNGRVCFGILALIGILLGGLLLASAPARAEISPEAAEAYNLGRELTSQGKLDQAIEKLRAALALEPAYAKAALALAYALEQKGLGEEARQEYGRAGEMDPTLTQAFSRRGNLALRAKAYEEAAASFEKAAANDSTLADVFVGMGSAYSELRDFPRAVPALERAVRLAPENADAHYLLAMAYFRQTGAPGTPNLAGAAQEFAQCLALAPTHASAPVAHFYAGLIAFQEKKYDQALAHFEATNQAQPTMAEAFYRKGQVLERLSRQQDAIAALKQAIVLKTNYGAAHYALARIYHQAKDVPNALAEYKEAVKDEAFEQAANAKKEIAALEDYLKKKAEADKAAAGAAPQKP